MIKEAIYHRPKNEYAYAIDDKTLHIRLRTKKNDVQKVSLIYGDPYEWQEEIGWISYETKMAFNGNDHLYDYWLVEVQPKFRRLRYGFHISNDQETIYYTEKGFLTEHPKDSGFFFCFPFLNTIDVFSPPEWVNDTVWYQIFPERFANGDPSTNPVGTLPWGSSAPTPTNFFGGDLQGVINHLDYLEELGVNGLYFTPIFKAHSNHKYDTIDYMEIDPQFGDKETFRLLIKECHKRGIRVMLDAVFNHSGLYFPPFQDVLKNGETSPYKDWFHIHDFPALQNDKANYDTFAFVPSMPKLNTENIEVKNYLLNVARYWVEEFDIDGWRLDVANEVDHAFWREFRSVVKKVKPDAYILGEIWHDAMPWLQGDQFDAVMNYPITTAIVDYFAKEKITAKEFRNNVTNVLNLYPETVNRVQFNLLGSHDTARILTLSNEKKEKVKLQMVFQFTLTGSPCIYYGDEISMSGENDPGCRECMIWEKDDQDREMFSFVQKLISLRKEHDLFRANNQFRFFQVNEDDDFLVYGKSNGENHLLVFLNNSPVTRELPVPVGYQGENGTELWTNKKIVLEKSIIMEEYQFLVYLF